MIGTDISPIQPSWVPPNLKLWVQRDRIAPCLLLVTRLTILPSLLSEIEDCTSPWTFEADSFDYVHFRWLFGSIVDWTELFRQAYRACKPGGYVETFEPDAWLTSDDGTVKETDALSLIHI